MNYKCSKKGKSLSSSTPLLTPFMQVAMMINVWIARSMFVTSATKGTVLAILDIVLGLVNCPSFFIKLALFLGPSGCDAKNCKACATTRVTCSECESGYQLRANTCYKKGPFHSSSSSHSCGSQLATMRIA